VIFTYNFLNYSTSKIEINPDEYIKESMDMEQFPEELDRFKSLMKAYIPPSNDDFPANKEFPKVLFLGTGSSIPNKTRNVSGILVHTR